MRISVDDQVLFSLSEVQKKVIMDEIDSDEFEIEMKRRLQWVLMHKYERCFQKLKDKWLDKLSSREHYLPTDPDKLAELIFSQKDYQDKKQRLKNGRV